MREKLKALEGVRARFRGRFERFGLKTFKHHAKRTALLLDITLARDPSTILADHVWLTVGTQIEALALQAGDLIEFTARVDSYWKGYKGRRRDDEYDDRPPRSKDYRLSHHAKIRRVKPPPAPPPDFDPGEPQDMAGEQMPLLFQ